MMVDWASSSTCHSRRSSTGDGSFTPKRSLPGSIDAADGLSPQLRVPSLLFMVAGWLFTLLAVALERVTELTEEGPMGILKLTALSVALVLGGYAVNLSAAAG